MTSFTQNSDAAVQCATCQHCPVTNRGFRCNAIGQHVTGKGYWRRCAAYQGKGRGQPLSLAPKPPMFTMPEYELDGKTFAIFCDDVWLVNHGGAEPAWASPDHEAVAIELFKRWMRRKRAEWHHHYAVEYRRASIRSVE